MRETPEFQHLNGLGTITKPSIEMHKYLYKRGKFQVRAMKSPILSGQDLDIQKSLHFYRKLLLRHTIGNEKKL